VLELDLELALASGSALASGLELDLELALASGLVRR
jgi:hypothetical protein